MPVWLAGFVLESRNRKASGWMSKHLIVIGGIQNILVLVFHLLFWELFRWPEDLSCLSHDNRAGMQVLDIQLMFLAFFAYVSLVYSKELMTTVLGRIICWFIVIFYFARILNQFVFWDPLMARSVVLVSGCLLTICLYLIPLMVSRKEFAMS